MNATVARNSIVASKSGCLYRVTRVTVIPEWYPRAGEISLSVVGRRNGKDYGAQRELLLADVTLAG